MPSLNIGAIIYLKPYLFY